MTVSTNPVPDFQRDQILTGAIRLCGLIPPGGAPEPEQIDAATFHLRLALQDLQSEGVNLTTVERTTLALSSGTAEYTLAADTLDVVMEQDDALGTIIDTSVSGETIVKTMGRGEWMQIADKTTAGRPSRVYVEKKNTTSVVFWPVPNSATMTFRYARTRLLKDNDTGATTLDLRRVWTPYLVNAIAAGVACDHSLFEKAQVFKNWAAEKLARCKAGDIQQGAIRFRVRHSGRNW